MGQRPCEFLFRLVKPGPTLLLINLCSSPVRAVSEDSRALLLEGFAPSNPPESWVALSAKRLETLEPRSAKPWNLDVLRLKYLPNLGWGASPSLRPPKPPNLGRLRPTNLPNLGGFSIHPIESNFAPQIARNVRSGPVIKFSSGSPVRSGIPSFSP